MKILHAKKALDMCFLYVSGVHKPHAVFACGAAANIKSVRFMMMPTAGRDACSSSLMTL